MPCGTMVTYSQKAAKKMAVCSQHLSLITNICRLKRFGRMGGGVGEQNFLSPCKQPLYFFLKEKQIYMYHIFSIVGRKRYFKRLFFKKKIKIKLCHIKEKEHSYTAVLLKNLLYFSYCDQSTFIACAVYRNNLVNTTSIDSGLFSARYPFILIEIWMPLR